MAYQISPLLDMKFQGLNLNCGRYSLEAVMRWHHGSKYGKVTPDDGPTKDNAGVWKVKYGALRTEHAPGAKAHIDKALACGFSVEKYGRPYGVVRLHEDGQRNWDLLDPKANWWESMLRQYGPIIVAGHIGAVRIIPLNAAGHFVTVVGVNGTHIQYQDSLRIVDEKMAEMDVARFNGLVHTSKTGDADVPTAHLFVAAVAE